VTIPSLKRSGILQTSNIMLIRDVSVYIKAEPPNLRCSLVMFMLSAALPFFRDVTISSTSLKTLWLAEIKFLKSSQIFLGELNCDTVTAIMFLWWFSTSYQKSKMVTIEKRIVTYPYGICYRDVFLSETIWHA